MALDLRRVLEIPTLYHFLQVMVGAIRCRKVALNTYLPISPGSRVFDIGCGPGHFVRCLPDNIEYHGFDVSQRYIDFAQLNFGQLGHFHCEIFDDSSKKKFGAADVVLMNALLHHLTDEEVLAAISAAKNCLVPGGALYTFDPCYRVGQPRMAKWFCDNDRGKFVRTEKEYLSLIGQVFTEIQSHVREDLLPVPATVIIMIARNN